MGAEEDRGAAIYLMLDGQDTTGIGYMALWGFGAKCVTGWSGVEWMGDTPQTVMTTRAPALLKINQNNPGVSICNIRIWKLDRWGWCPQKPAA